MSSDALILARIEDERRRVPAATELLEKQPLTRQKWLVHNRGELVSYALAEHFLERGRDAWHADARRAEGLAELALEVAELLDPELYGTARVNDLLARSWAYIGNARRILSNYRSVEEAFRAAEFFLARGSGSAADKASLLSFRAALMRGLRRYDEAAVLLDAAAECLGEETELPRRISLLNDKAIVLQERGATAEAIEVLEGLLRQLGELDVSGQDRSELQRLFFYAQYNLVSYLNEVGRTAEARGHLPRMRQLAERHAESLDWLRIDWLEGLILLKTGQEREAERMLVSVRDRFVEAGIGYDAALVSLKLAHLYLRRGRTEQAKQLAVELVPIFESRDVHREALAALLIFQRALRQETATVSQVLEVTEYLNRSRANAAAPYRSGSGT